MASREKGGTKEKQHGDCELLFDDLIVVREMWDLGMFLGTIGHIFKKSINCPELQNRNFLWGGGRSFQLRKVKHIEW